MTQADWLAMLARLESQQTAAERADWATRRVISLYETWAPANAANRAGLRAMRDAFGGVVHDLSAPVERSDGDGEGPPAFAPLPADFLLNDLAGSAALVAALDAVVTPMVSTLDLAGAVGTTPVLAFVPTLRHARLLGSGQPPPRGDGGLDRLGWARRPRVPWFGSVVDVFAQEPEFSGSWDGVFAAIAAELGRIAGAR